MTSINTSQDASLIASLNTANSSVGKKSSDTSTAETQDRFLLMLTTQLKNQDPLNPMDNAQITSQMAQLSTVSGIDKLNATLKALSDSMTMGQSVSATSMIGHGVLVPGSTLNLSNSQAIGGVELTQPADSVNVTIQDAAGNTVRTLQLGAQDAGILPFTWDGMTDAGTSAGDGTYKFNVEAMLSGNKSTSASLSFGVVNAVTPGTDGAMLGVGNMGGFALSTVKQVL